MTSAPRLGFRATRRLLGGVTGQAGTLRPPQEPAGSLLRCFPTASSRGALGGGCKGGLGRMHRGGAGLAGLEVRGRAAEECGRRNAGRGAALPLARWRRPACALRWGDLAAPERQLSYPAGGGGWGGLRPGGSSAVRSERLATAGQTVVPQNAGAPTPKPERRAWRRGAKGAPGTQAAGQPA